MTFDSVFIPYNNDIIYYNYQDNRNPFIDHPEIVEHLWGDKMGLNWPEMPLNVTEFSDDSIKLYPNPVRNTLNIQLEERLEKVEVYSILGRKVLENTTSNVNVSNLSSGMYLLKVYTQDCKVGVKRFVKE